VAQLCQRHTTSIPIEPVVIYDFRIYKDGAVFQPPPDYHELEPLPF
jgi:hypothetical protein